MTKARISRLQMKLNVQLIRKEKQNNTKDK